MSNPRASRSRAVCLTTEASEILRKEIAVAWMQSHGSGKLTRETKAEILGVSIVTCDRILSGKGVDRASLTHAFKSLGVEWDDKYCEPAGGLAPEPDPETRQESEQTVSIEKPTPRLRLIRALSVLVCMVLVGVAWVTTNAKREDNSLTWQRVATAAFQRCTDLYHEGKFEQARKELVVLKEIARNHDSAAAMSGAFRLGADIDGAEGSLENAKEGYKSAIRLRADLESDGTIPSIKEALGDVETRAGDYSDAEKTLLEALEGFSRYKDPVGVAMASRNLGTLSFVQKDLSGAERWFTYAFRSIYGLDKPDLEADLRGRQALLWHAQGKAGAEEQLRKCLEYWTTKNHPRWIAVTQYQLGTIQSDAGATGEAERLLKLSQIGFQKVGDKAGARNASVALRKLVSGSPGSGHRF